MVNDTMYVFAYIKGDALALNPALWVALALTLIFTITETLLLDSCSLQAIESVRPRSRWAVRAVAHSSGKGGEHWVGGANPNIPKPSLAE